MSWVHACFYQAFDECTPELQADTRALHAHQFVQAFAVLDRKAERKVDVGPRSGQLDALPFESDFLEATAGRLRGSPSRRSAMTPRRTSLVPP